MTRTFKTGRRRAALAVAAASLVLVAAAPASARPTQSQAPAPGGYEADASGTALHLSVLGQGLTVGEAVTHIDSSVNASARAAARIEPLLGGEVEASATTPPGGPDVDKNPAQVCDPAIPAIIPGVDISIGCADAQAKIAGGLPTATATGAEVVLTANAGTLLDTIGLGDILDDGVTTVLDSLDQVLDLGGALLDPLQDTLRDVLEDVLDVPLASVVVTPATSKTTATDTQVTAEATSAAATVNLLPGAVASGPLARIEVAPASAKSVADRTTGKTTDSSKAHLVRISLAPELGTALGGQPIAPIELLPGASICPPLPAPLTLCVTVAADGRAVEIRALEGIQGGVVVALGAADASAAATPGLVPTSEPPSRPELPTTGGPENLGLVAAGLGALAVGGLWLRKRISA